MNRYLKLINMNIKKIQDFKLMLKHIENIFCDFLSNFKVNYLKNKHYLYASSEAKHEIITKDSLLPRKKWNYGIFEQGEALLKYTGCFRGIRTCNNFEIFINTYCKIYFKRIKEFDIISFFKGLPLRKRDISSAFYLCK